MLGSSKESYKGMLLVTFPKTDSGKIDLCALHRLPKLGTSLPISV